MSAVRAPIFLGSSSFTAKGWLGSFYPRGTRPSDFLSVYAEQFDTVELDVTWYRTPTRSMVDAWRSKTPDGFVFAAKMPQTITHDKILEDCRAETNEFLRAMEGLGDKLGPLLLQFPRFSKEYFKEPGEFLAVLRAYLQQLPTSMRFAVEIRNRDWVDAPLLELLRDHGVAFALTDHAQMERPRRVLERLDPITADFTYIRWIGDRHGIEKIVKVWDRVVVDRTAELDDWADICQGVRRHGVTVFGYANNHYAGHSPVTIRDLLQRIEPSLLRKAPEPAQRGLFS